MAHTFIRLASLLLVFCFCLPYAHAADDDWILQIIPVITARRSTPTPTPTPTGPLPDTGVTTCYSDTGIITCPAEGEAFYGQDAQYNPPKQQRSYTDNGDGTVTDNITGLMWVKTDDATPRVWQDAYDYCQACTDYGYEDWRLPTNYELQNLVDWSRNRPSIDPIFTNCNFDTMYWSGTPRAEFPDVVAWCTDFFGGEAEYEHKVKYSYYTRCVRGETVTQRFRSISGTQVYDTVTGLTWQKTDDGLKYTWEEALAFCENCEIGGHEDWRLPNIVELYSILDLTKWEPAIDTSVFDCQPSEYPVFWSSTTGSGNYSGAWYVSFAQGETYSCDKAVPIYVRCVRGGQ